MARAWIEAPRNEASQPAYIYERSSLRIKENPVYTSKQAISALLGSDGPQSFDTLVLECRIQATDKPDVQSVKSVLAEMIESNEVFTDGYEYSTNADDFDKSKLIHFSEFLIKAFD